MAVYVDALFYAVSSNAQARRHGNQWCHLWADTEEELDAVAAKIGLKRAYKQRGLGGRFIHYDLTPNKRKQAVAAGAVEKSLREWMREMKG